MSWITGGSPLTLLMRGTTRVELSTPGIGNYVTQNLHYTSRLTGVVKIRYLGTLEAL